MSKFITMSTHSTPQFPNSSAPPQRTMTRLQSLLSTLPPIDLPVRPMPLKEFTLFPKLPAELRSKVWRYATQVTRKVKLFELGSLSTKNGCDSKVEGQTPIPGVMQACQESRYEGAKIYKLCYEKPQDFQSFADAGANQVEIVVMASGSISAIGLTSEENLRVVTSKKGNAIYINFDQDIFVETPISHGSITRNEDENPYIPQRPGWCKLDPYTHKPSCVAQIQRLEQIHYKGAGFYPDFLERSPIRQLTRAMVHHTYPNGDNVGGDLSRCSFACHFWPTLQKVLGQMKITILVPFEDMRFEVRWLKDFGDDLDPSPGVVTPPRQPDGHYPTIVEE
ncbi:hypothetical protein DL98DRAFT_661119 [Cadophora sp. DSE1049]|nr:hypothetical protein DL98DRAFT_661119 [Cadophora sp. DSE1049]